MSAAKKRYLVKAAARFRVMADALDKAMAESPFKASCSRGCAACCKQVIFCTPAEAALIVRTYPKVVRELKGELRAQAARVFATAASEGLKTGELVGSPNMGKLCDAWWREQAACAFLEPATNDCRVYEARPAACRTYAVQSDPKHCATLDPSQVEIIGIEPKNVARGLAWADGGEPAAGPIGHMVLWALAEMR